MNSSAELGYTRTIHMNNDYLKSPKLFMEYPQRNKHNCNCKWWPTRCKYFGLFIYS